MGLCIIILDIFTQGMINLAIMLLDIVLMVTNLMLIIHSQFCTNFFLNTSQIEVIQKFEEICLESAKEFSPLFSKV